MEYRFEKLDSHNFTDMITVHKAVYGAHYNEAALIRKYDTTYLGMKHFGHIAYYGNQPVAFHGAIPVQMKHKDQLEMAAQYSDIMTLKNHTGKGLFPKLSELTNTLLQEAGITFVWGFPNQNAEYSTVNKLQWHYVERMKIFKVEASPFPLDKIAAKTSFTAKLYAQKVEAVFLKYSVNAVVPGSVFLEKEVVSVNRDKAYYDYKSFTGNFTIEINETLFWIKIKNGILIGDAAIKSIEKFDEALQILKNLASKNGLGAIIFQASPTTLLSQIMETRADKKSDSWITGFKNFNSGFPLEQLKFTFGDLDTF